MKDISELDLWNQPDEGDPLARLRKHRDEIARKYPTSEELRAYLKSIPSPSEMRRELELQIAEKHRKGYKSTDYYDGTDE